MTVPVVLVGPLPPFRSGIADQTLRLARALAQVGADPSVVTFRRLYPRLLYPGASDRGPGSFPVDLAVEALLDGANPFSFRAAARAIAARGPALVVVPWWTAFLGPHVELLLSALARRAPRAARLLLCHNVVDHEASAGKRLLARRALSRATHLAAQNGRDAQVLRGQLPGRSVTVVPHPSEPRPRLLPRDEARRLLGVAEGAPPGPLFLFTGLLRPYKGWDLLLEAFASVRREVPGARLVLAGEPWGAARRLLADGLPDGVRGELRYLPEDERDLWLDACDAVVCPYRDATGSGIAADALAHGRPLIGTRVAGLLEVVEEGVSGLLVPPGDADALAVAMIRFERERLGEELARGAAERRSLFSPEAHARAILAAGGIGP